MSDGSRKDSDYIEEAAQWAKQLIHQESRGPGDYDNARRRIARKTRIPYSLLWALAYRKPRVINTGWYFKLMEEYNKRNTKEFCVEILNNSEAKCSKRWPGLAGRIEDGRHVLPVRVYYEDTDFSGVVYHASYLRFCERGRSDFLRVTGVFHGELEAEGLGFAVRHMEIDFLKPARMDDVLEVETRLAGLSGAALALDQRIVRQGDILFTVRVKVVVVDRRGRPRRLPADLKRRLLPHP